MKKIGIALGGGGARGLAHVGVLKVVEREKIPLSCIAGTSMGAIVGACYAVNPDIAAVEANIRKTLSSSIFSHIKIDKLKDDLSGEKKSLFQKAQEFIKDGYLLIVEQTQYALLAIEKLEQVINMLLPDIEITRTKIPFACVATDLTNGKAKVFAGGSLRASVLASASIPGVFPPVRINGIYYNDGGAVSVTPVREVRAMGADFVIAANVKSRIMRWEKPEKAREIMSRSNYITGVILNELFLKDADIVISPEVRHLHWTAFDKLDLIIKKGEAAAAGKVLEIKLKTSYQTVMDKLRNLFRFGVAQQTPPS